MKKEHAKRVSQIFGVLILISTLLAWKFGASPRSLLHSMSGATLFMVGSMFPLWCFCLWGSIGLLQGRSYGFYCMAVALVLSVVGSTYSFIPFVSRFFLHSPSAEVYFWAVNGTVIVVLGVLEYFARWRRTA